MNNQNELYLLLSTHTGAMNYHQATLCAIWIPPWLPWALTRHYRLQALLTWPGLSYSSRELTFCGSWTWHCLSTPCTLLCSAMEFFLGLQHTLHCVISTGTINNNRALFFMCINFTIIIGFILLSSLLLFIPFIIRHFYTYLCITYTGSVLLLCDHVALLYKNGLASWCR